MKKFLLITIPKLNVDMPPAVLAALAPVIENSGYSLDLFDFNLELFHYLNDVEHQNLVNFCELSSSTLSESILQKIINHFTFCINKMIDSDTCYVGISIFSIYSIRISVPLIKSIREKYPHIKIICGGNALASKIDNMPNMFGEILIENNLVDYCIYGEGEIALHNILIGKSDQQVINKDRKNQISNLDVLPFASYKKLDISRYSNKRLFITGSRGCVRDCTFCDIAKSWPNFRYRSAKNILEELIQNYYETGITQFEFTDSLINGSTKNFHQFNELLANEKEKNKDLEPIRYSGQFICKQSSNMRPEVYEYMHYAGCNQITVGIESFSESIRYHMKKKFTDADIDYHLEQCAYWGISNVFLMIVGYPTETIEDHLNTIETLKKYQIYSQMNIISHIRWGLTMHIYEDTPLASMLNDLGISNDLHNIRDGIYSWASTKNPTLTVLERIRRRIELHEVSYNLGYKMPNVTSELMSLKALAMETIK